MTVHDINIPSYFRCFTDHWSVLYLLQIAHHLKFEREAHSVYDCTDPPMLMPELANYLKSLHRHQEVFEQRVKISESLLSSISAVISSLTEACDVACNKANKPLKEKIIVSLVDHVEGESAFHVNLNLHRMCYSFPDWLSSPNSITKTLKEHIYFSDLKNSDHLKYT